MRERFPADVPGAEAPYARAKKSLGQNFLTDPNVARRIVGLLEIKAGDRVLEIGPGRGALTRPLDEALRAAGGGELRAVEKDTDLAARLRESLPGCALTEGDALKYPWEDLDGDKVAGNLPYNIASRLIWDLAERGGGMERGVFMVQHEVALRLTADPGGKEYGALGAWVRNFCFARYAFKVPPTAFTPRPRVDSALVVLTPRPAGERPEDPAGLARILKHCFQFRRKQMGTILRSFEARAVADWFAATGISPQVRPEVVAPEAFVLLSQCLRGRFST
jgi:16S rRNA (adenine1518-N6/adenine1519-N6)-dimethyltransferase